MAKFFRLMLPLALLAFAPGTARADDVFVGVLAHDIRTPITSGGFESGADLQIGWRGGRIGALRAVGSPSPYLLGSLSSDGGTSLAAAGLSWRIGGQFYVRPGIGVAVHNRDSLIVGDDGLRQDLGSRILFEPEVGVGYQVSERISVEASWVHLSHARIFSRQNPGMDSVGVRLNYSFR